MKVIGVDPGRHCGIAVLEHRDGQRPLLVSLDTVRSPSDEAWMGRVELALSAHLDADFAFVEQPPQTFAGELEGDRRGTSTWLGMGRRKGIVEGVWWALTHRSMETLEHRDWTSSFFPPILKKKSGVGKNFGRHRIQEARLFVEDDRDRLGSIPESYRVDAAEAVLIACAGLSRARRR